MNPRVQSVVATKELRLCLAFSNGETGIFDCSHLTSFGVFHEFQDVSYFLRAAVAHGTVVWPNGQDICPDTLYEDSLKLAPHSPQQSNPADVRTDAAPHGPSAAARG